jgi:WD40 repeat protein
MTAPLVGIVFAFTQCGGCGQCCQKVSHVEFSPDGNTLAAVLYTARDVHVPLKYSLDDICRTVALVTVRADRAPQVIEQKLLTGTRSESLYYPPGASIAFCSGGDALAIAPLGGGTVRFWNRRSRQWRVPFRQKKPSAQHIAVSPDGTILAAAQAVWFEGRPVTIRGLSRFSRSENGTVPVGNPVRFLSLWDVSTGNLLREFPAGGIVTGGARVRFSPDGSVLATAEPDGASLWEVATGKHLASLGGRISSGFPVALCFSPDDETLAVAVLAAGTDSGIRLYSLKGGSQAGMPRELSKDLAWTAAFSPDGTLLAAAGRDGVRLLDPANPAESGELLCQHPVPSLAFSPDGSLLATGDYNGDVIFWDVASRKPVRTVRIHGKWRMHWRVPATMLGAWVLICAALWLRRRARATR